MPAAASSARPGTMAVATLVSRVTGLLRTVVLAGAPWRGALVDDAYNTVNTLPNIVYELLLGGVLTSVIVPLLVHAQERDRDGGVGYAQRLTTVAIAGLAVGDRAGDPRGSAADPALQHHRRPEQVRAGQLAGPLLLIEIVFYGVGALAQAILNSRDVFGPPAWAPVLNNVVVIATGAAVHGRQRPGQAHPGHDHAGPGLAPRHRHHARHRRPGPRPAAAAAAARGAAAPALGAQEHRPAGGRAASACG